MLHKRPEAVPASTLAAGGRRWLWAVMTLDVMAAAWMISMGDWLDSTSRVTAVVTLGGHHWIVTVLALVGFALLAVLATLTRGYAEVNRLQGRLIAGAGVVSVVALAGILAVGVVVMLVVLLLSGRRVLHVLTFGLF